MTRIFLAFHQDNLRQAEQIAEHLEQNKHDVWFDKNGNASAKDIQKQLKRASYFIYALSPTSATFPACRLQLQEAQKAGLTIIPTVIHPQAPVLPELQGLPIVNMMGGVSISGLEQLVQAVGGSGGGRAKKEKQPRQSGRQAAQQGGTRAAATPPSPARSGGLGAVIFELMLVVILVLAVVLISFVALNNDEDGPALLGAVISDEIPADFNPDDLTPAVTAISTEAVVPVETAVSTEVTPVATATATEITPVETAVVTEVVAQPTATLTEETPTEEAPTAVTALATAAVTEIVAVAQATDAPTEETPTAAPATVTPTATSTVASVVNNGNDGNTTSQNNPTATDMPTDVPTATATDTALPTATATTIPASATPTVTFTPTVTQTPNVTATPSPTVTITPTVEPSPTLVASDFDFLDSDLVLRWDENSLVIFNNSGQLLGLQGLKFAFTDLSDHYDGSAYLGIDFSRNFGDGNCEIIAASEFTPPSYCDTTDFTPSISRRQSSYVWVWDPEVNPEGVFVVTLNDVPLQTCAIADGQCQVNIPYARLAGTIPSSGWIVFARDGDLFIINGNGENELQLTSTTATEMQPAFSPDGGKIVYASNEGGDFELYMMNIDGTDIEQLTGNESDDVAPAWGPDGDQIAFQSNRNGNDDLFILSLESNDLRQITNTPANEQAPTWSPDGRTIFYQSDAPGDYDIFSTDVQLGNRNQLTSVAPDHTFPVLASDGQTLFFSSDRRNSNFELWSVILVDGDLAVDTLTQVTTDSNADTLPSISPDGRRVVYVSVVDGVPQLRLYDGLMGGAISTLAVGTDPDFFPLNP